MKEIIKFIARFIQKTCILLLISLPIQLVGALALLVYLPLHRKKAAKELGTMKSGREILQLPYLLKWFDNADIWVGRDYSTYNRIFFGDFWTHYNWLAWRNPTNYFEYAYLGVNITESIILTQFYESTNYPIGDSTNHRQGWYYVEIMHKNKIYYEYYGILVYNIPGMSTPLCIRFRMGWKLDQSTVQGKGWAQQAFVINPFATFSGSR
jgi:hypothetical protein